MVSTSTLISMYDLVSNSIGTNDENNLIDSQ